MSVETAKKLKALKDELEAILKRYNAELSGCGCCGSPWITLNKEDGTELDTEDNVRLNT